MSPDENKAFVRRLFHEVWNEGDLAVLEETPTLALLEPASVTAADRTDFRGIRQDVAAFRATYPHLRFTVEHQWASGNTVVTVWSATGTDQTWAQGHYASNAQATVTGVDVIRFPA